jgi:hypothetical protein
MTIRTEGFPGAVPLSISREMAGSARTGGG